MNRELTEIEKKCLVEETEQSRRSLLRDTLDHDADDICQTVRIKAIPLMQANILKLDEYFGPWIGKATLRARIDYFRKKNGRPRPQKSPEDRYEEALSNGFAEDSEFGRKDFMDMCERECKLSSPRKTISLIDETLADDRVGLGLKLATQAFIEYLERHHPDSLTLVKLKHKLTLRQLTEREIDPKILMINDYQSTTVYKKAYAKAFNRVRETIKKERNQLLSPSVRELLLKCSLEYARSVSYTEGFDTVEEINRLYGCDAEE